METELPPKKIVTTLQAIEKVKRYCATAEHCQMEVRQKLYHYQVNQELIESIICDLISEGYIDELRYATAFVSGKFNIKNWGRLKICVELRKKNISQKCINLALKEISAEAQREKLDIVAKKWLKTHKEPTPIKLNQKLARYLLSKGYQSEEVWNYLNKK